MENTKQHNKVDKVGTERSLTSKEIAALTKQWVELVASLNNKDNNIEHHGTFSIHDLASGHYAAPRDPINQWNSLNKEMDKVIKYHKFLSSYSNVAADQFSKYYITLVIDEFFGATIQTQIEDAFKLIIDNLRDHID